MHTHIADLKQIFFLADHHSYECSFHSTSTSVVWEYTKQELHLPKYYGHWTLIDIILACCTNLIKGLGILGNEVLLHVIMVFFTGV